MQQAQQLEVEQLGDHGAWVMSQGRGVLGSSHRCHLCCRWTLLGTVVCGESSQGRAHQGLLGQRNIPSEGQQLTSSDLVQ
jgi:hypothetical protein